MSESMPIDLIITLIHSTASHKCGRIQRKRNMKAYQDAINECISTYITYPFSSIATLEAHVTSFRTKLNNSLPVVPFSRRRDYMLMAIDDVIDIIKSIRMRFVDGGEGSAESCAQAILERSGYKP
jgi:hypothetical protein